MITQTTKYLPLIFALALALIISPYTGIRHDSTLYLGQALLHLNKTTYYNDLFFQFGSQANFTLFPELIGALLEHIRPDCLFLAATLLAKILFLMSSSSLINTIYRKKNYKPYALFCLIAIPSYYGSYWIFSYNESFFTGRSLAEPLAIWSLSYLIRGKTKKAAVTLLLSALIHPLQAIPALLVGWFYLVKCRKIKYTIPILATCSIIFATKLEMAPQLLNQYDENWKEWILGPNKHVFLREWSLAAWIYISLDFIIVGLAFKLLEERARKIVFSFALAAAFGLSLSLLTTDILEIVSFTGAQLWRTQWVLHWLAVSLCPILFFHLAAIDKKKLIILAFAITNTYLPSDSFWTPLASILALVIFFTTNQIRAHSRAGFENALIFALIFGILLMTATSINHIIQLDKSNLREFRIDSLLLKSPFFIFSALVILPHIRGHDFTEKKLITAGVLSLLVFAYASIKFDSRSQWTKILESSSFRQPFKNIPQAAQVYWPEELLGIWLVVNRPSYFTDQQQAGLLFNRKTAEEAYRRRQALSIISVQKEICQSIATFDKNQSCEPTAETISEICEASQHIITNVILENKINNLTFEKWTTGIDTDGKKIELYSYLCTKESK